MESLYWVFTLKCNDFCDHCYNHSGPHGEVVDTGELLRVVPHLPERLGRIILSGGEPLTEMEKLLTLVRALRRRYGEEVSLGLQSNGDLLDERRLRRVLEAGIDRIDIASMDRFHRKKGRHAQKLVELFEGFGMVNAREPAKGARRNAYALWGANEEFWLGGNWARGRALETGVALMEPGHNFCALWSGAIGFLDEGTEKQEVHIQFYRLYPCCPTTLYALGDVRREKVEDILERYRKETAFQILNRGDVYGLGTSEGLSREFIRRRIEALGDVCLWCDEYFERYYRGPKGERRRGSQDQT